MAKLTLEQAIKLLEAAYVQHNRATAKKAITKLFEKWGPELTDVIEDYRRGSAWIKSKSKFIDLSFRLSYNYKLYLTDFTPQIQECIAHHMHMLYTPLFRNTLYHS